MPRTPAQTSDQIRDRALHQFWVHGSRGTSIDDLVRETGASRHALYQTFGDKRGLFLACLDAYPAVGVDPAFSCVERPGATLTDIEHFFELQVRSAERLGFPARGCLFANTMTELGPHDAEIAARVRAHHERLASGFSTAFHNSLQPGLRMSRQRIDDLARLMVISAQGMWSASRTMTDARELRRGIASLMRLVRSQLHADA